MSNIKLILEFDGTAFFGWQRQNDVRTVQGEVEEAARSIFGTDVEVIGAGRTDAGVHASAFVCNFHVDTAIPPRRIVTALNARLPEDVVVRSAEEVAADFHARFDAVSRRYAYHITRTRTALRRFTHYHCRFDLDVAAMRRAAGALVGSHDFTSFTPAENEAGAVCDVSRVDIDEGPDGAVTVTVEANRFIHNMVRIIVGTLIDVGRGRTAPEHMTDIMRKKDRRAAGPTVPPHGLVLVSVRYDRD